MSQLPTEAAVTSNVAPKHYGVSARAMYDPARDAGETKHYDRYEDVYRVNTMTWYIQKGDDLIRSRKIEFPFYRTWDANPSHEPLQIEEELMECALDKAPDHPKPSRRSLVQFLVPQNPSCRRIFADSPGGVVTRNCTLKTDLSVVPMDSSKKRTRTLENGEKLECWQLYCKLLVTIQSGPMIFSILCGRKEYGQIGTDY